MAKVVKPNQARFVEEYGMPLAEVKRLVSLAWRAGRRNEHFSNGDPHHLSKDARDKNENAKHWADDVAAITQEISELVAKYGFTEVTFAGLGPTLKRGSQFVEVPY